jgi:hypothetical protein
MAMKKYKNSIFAIGWCWRHIYPAPPVNFCDSGKMYDIQIAKLVMQMHDNNVLIIDKKSNFPCGRCWRNARLDFAS